MRKIFLISLIFLLMGCASMKKSQVCNIGTDGKCGSLDAVFNKQEKEKKEVIGYPLSGYAGSPIRSGENVQQIWLGPYEDEDGNFHEPSYVYTVVKKGIWFGEPAEAIQN